jgi:hypothetical protein
MAADRRQVAEDWWCDAMLDWIADATGIPRDELTSEPGKGAEMRVAKLKEKVDEAIRHLDLVDAHKIPDHDELPPFKVHLRDAWQALQQAYDLLGGDGDVPSVLDQQEAARVKLTLARARLAEAEARRVHAEVSGELSVLGAGEATVELTEHDSDLLGDIQRLESRLHQVEEKVAGVRELEELIGRIRDTVVEKIHGGDDDLRESLPLTEITVRLGDLEQQVDALMTQEEPVSAWGQAVEQRLAAVDGKVGGPDGPWSTTLAERLAAFGRRLRDVERELGLLGDEEDPS